MARILSDKELKAIMKTLMYVWQEENDSEQLGLNLANDMLCKVDVCDKMEALLNGDDNYEYHLHESEWFDDNVAELLEMYHQKEKEKKAREQAAEEMADKLNVKDMGNGVVRFSVDDDEQEQDE